MHSMTSLLDKTHDTGYTGTQLQAYPTLNIRHSLTTARERFTQDDHVWLDVVPLVAKPGWNQRSPWTLNSAILTSYPFCTNQSEFRHR
jgi:hypothetical protein